MKKDIWDKDDARSDLRKSRSVLKKKKKKKHNETKTEKKKIVN